MVVKQGRVRARHVIGGSLSHRSIFFPGQSPQISKAVGEIPGEDDAEPVGQGEGQGRPLHYLHHGVWCCYCPTRSPSILRSVVWDGSGPIRIRVGSYGPRPTTDYMHPCLQDFFAKLHGHKSEQAVPVEKGGSFHRHRLFGFARWSYGELHVGPRRA